MANDPNNRVPAPDAATVEQMANWHSSMGDPIYAAMSCWYGGHTVTRETAERALAALERLEDSELWGAADADMLAALRAHLGDD